MTNKSEAALDRITKKNVQLIGPGPNARTVMIRHVDGSTQIQFKSMLKNI